MRQLIAALLVTALIAACSSSTGPGSDVPPAEYPFTEQTFKVVSGEEAEWLGVSGMQKVSSGFFMADTSDSTETDTTEINQPRDYGLKIVESKFESSYNVQFIDSTITNSVFDSLDLGPNRSDTLFGSTLEGVQGSFESGYLEIEYRYSFDCSKEYTPTDTLHIYWLNGAQDDTARVYELPISGALESANHIVCES